MQTIQQGSRVEIAQTGELATGDSANSNERVAAKRFQAGALPPSPKRWVPSRKAEIVEAVRSGFISLDDALERYGLSIDEYLTWQRGLELFGLAGLRVNRTKHLRRAATRFSDR